MKSGYRYILYIIIALIALSSLTLFLFRNEAVVFLTDNAGVAQSALPTKANTSANANVLDVEILKSPKFLALKNNVVNFDFDSICKTAVGTSITVATTSTGELATSTQSLNCLLGNGLPFPLATKKQ